jgi:hypothetical protein
MDVRQRVDTHPQDGVAELRPRFWKDHFTADSTRSLIDR